jgi:predicted nuclease of predicted toxin-antitoxin system
MMIVVDMNLSPLWTEILNEAGHQSLHWSSIGSENAPDREIMQWADVNGAAVLTSDLDFGAALAASSRSGPSIIQLRVGRHLPSKFARLLIDSIAAASVELALGAILSIDRKRFRIRLLPIVEAD